MGMGTANKVGVGTCTDSVADARVVAEDMILYVDGHSALRSGNAGQLPAAQESLHQSRGLAEERKVVDVADVEDMALIKIGAGLVGVQVVGVHEGCVRAIRRIID